MAGEPRRKTVDVQFLYQFIQRIRFGMERRTSA